MLGLSDKEWEDLKKNQREYNRRALRREAIMCGECNFPEIKTTEVGKVEAEYGSVGGVRFLNPENVRMYDGDGNVMVCKCGRPAGAGAMGKEAYSVWCKECAPISKEEADFVYKDPK